MNPNTTMIESPREDSQNTQSEQVAPSSLSLKRIEVADSVKNVDALMGHGILLAD